LGVDAVAVVDGADEDVDLSFAGAVGGDVHGPVEDGVLRLRVHLHAGRHDVAGDVELELGHLQTLAAGAGRPVIADGDGNAGEVAGDDERRQRGGRGQAVVAGEATAHGIGARAASDEAHGNEEDAAHAAS